MSLPLNEIDNRAGILFPDPMAQIVVYCGGPECPLGAHAQAHLIRLGYQNVLLYSGGLAEWKGQGRSFATEAEPTNSTTRRDAFSSLVNAMSVGQWGGLWLAMLGVSAVIYWLGGRTPWPGLYHDGRPLDTGMQGFADCVYFSVVTATTLGYGDITPLTTWARVLSATEAVGGMLLVGALISRLLSEQQEKLLRDTHSLAFQERLGRMQTSLHLLIADFQDMENMHMRQLIDQPRIQLRLSSGATILVRDLRIVQELLADHGNQADETSLELLLVTLNGALQAYLDVLAICKAGQSRIATHLGKVVSDICSECAPSGFSEETKTLIQRTETLGQKILMAGT
jgi:hypothetical protein